MNNLSRSHSWQVTLGNSFRLTKMRIWKTGTQLNRMNKALLSTYYVQGCKEEQETHPCQWGISHLPGESRVKKQQWI